MRIVAPGFLVGVLLLQQLSTLPAPALSGLLVVLVPLLFYSKTLRLPAAVAAGIFWALLQAQWQLATGLEPALEGEDLILVGTIASLPNVRDRSVRFLLDIEEPAELLDSRVRLNWYQDAPDLSPGQRWRLIARLKRPRGFRNPGGFDYEGWLFRNGIDATGYVREAGQAELLSAAGLARPVTRWRQHISRRLELALPDDPNTGVITGLSIGSRDKISRSQWDLLTRTGTNHLLAISGLHIGVVAGFVFLVVYRAWRRFPGLSLRWPAAKAAALAAFAGGAGYALLAGFSVPTQRAAVMLLVVLGAVLSDRHSRAAQVVLAALLAVLIWDTSSVLSPGFWLSFSAVAVIVYAHGGRLQQRGRLWQVGYVQWVVAIALVPLTLVFFQSGALVAPLANLFAVPWVSIVVVPLTLIGALLASIAPFAGSWALALASWGIDQLWAVLQWFGDQPFAVWQHAPPAWSLLPAACGVALLLAPRGWPARWLGLVLMLPLGLASSPLPDAGELEFTMLDVGQGLSAIVRTRHHVLVFDTGARFSDTFNIGDAVLVPFLRTRGVSRVDMLIVSHPDNDHIGGAEALLRNFNVARVLTSDTDALAAWHAERCSAGQRWVWDSVVFEMLHPEPNWLSSENDASCVLRISNATGAVLITGDIEEQAEAHLLTRYGDTLRSEVMLVPHHGSRTSSTDAFIGVVNPDVALVSTGYRNRFGFPVAEVVERYRSRDIPLHDTAVEGAVTVALHPVHGVVVSSERSGRRVRYWNTRMTSVVTDQPSFR